MILAIALPLGGAQGADAPQEINWKDLVPRAAAPEPVKPKTFFSGAMPIDPDAPAPPPIAESKFMQIKRKQPGEGGPPPVVAELNGKSVRIGGYIVPLDFEATNIKEFLLVPFVGACIHVPPPPANQIIYVKVAKGFDVTGAFDPVTVSGTLRTEVAFTGLADTGYSMDADLVEPRKE
jgi:hypothetical protein